MDFDLYRSLIAQVDRPEIIRLQYSGESIHYPHLMEAIALAKQAGAEVELVSAFASISPAGVRSLPPRAWTGLPSPSRPVMPTA